MYGGKQLSYDATTNIQQVRLDTGSVILIKYVFDDGTHSDQKKAALIQPRSILLRLIQLLLIQLRKLYQTS